MERVFKFREWDGKKINYNPFIINTINRNIGYEININENLESNKYSLMQYTGVKDRNGKEIYEGDIVNIHLPNEQIIIAEIVWEYCCTVLRMDKRADIAFTEAEKECQGRQIPFQEILEVIGNIHENPNL
jgi:uncharacterized phage protein (TIGR01671 family)